MSRYGSFEDPYCYSGIAVLRNCEGLRTEAALEEFEVSAVALRLSEPFPAGAFDQSHYRAIHHHLFKDVYDWAGEYRTVRIAKPGAMFCYPEHIAEQMNLLFGSLQEAFFTPGATQQDFVTNSARFLGDLNAIHLFRDGNGRAQLTFLFLLGQRAGHSLDMARIRPKPMLAAMVASFKGKLEPLENEIAGLCC